MSFTKKNNVVPVRQYQRYRFDKWETVCKHTRSYPKR
jgi:hypothetical protein